MNPILTPNPSSRQIPAPRFALMEPNPPRLETSDPQTDAGPKNRNELWSRALLDELARAGVRHLVVSPGSRSTPLVLAAAADPRFETAVQVDERSAGFLALGVGKATGIPAVVLTTSGTAVANLLPAVVEAAQSEVPLLVLTADRPPRLRGADANQAIDQVHLFGRYVRFFQEISPATVTDPALRHLRGVANRAVAEARGEPAGPVHLNVAFEKPLEPVFVPGDLPAGLEGLEGLSQLAREGRAEGAPFTRIHRRLARPHDADLEALLARLRAARRPLIVAGPDPRALERGPALAAFAEQWGVPLLADPLSGARGRHPGHSYDLALRVPEVRDTLPPDLIVRFGTTPSSMALAGCLELWVEVPQIVVDAGARWKDHLAVASDVIAGDPGEVARWLSERAPERGLQGAPREEGISWLEQWARIDAVLQGVVGEALAEGTLPEGIAAVEAARSTDEKEILFISNSMPIRDIDLLWPLGTDAPPPTLLRALGNRGASGIDGIVSTAFGVAWGAKAPVTLLLGDLALFHDQNGFMALGTFDLGPVNVVVVNNDGGGIFHLLPVREYDPAFTRFVVTPHGREPEGVAALHGIPFKRIDARKAARTESSRAEIELADLEALDPAYLVRALRQHLSTRLPSEGRAGGVQMLEVRTDREENRDAHQDLVARARAAVKRLLAT